MSIFIVSAYLACQRYLGVAGDISSVSGESVSVTFWLAAIQSAASAQPAVSLAALYVSMANGGGIKCLAAIQ